MTSINPNDTVSIKLTDYGREQIKNHIEELNNHYEARGIKLRATEPKESDGWLKGQFWSLM